jgi:hypothetical protein
MDAFVWKGGRCLLPDPALLIPPWGILRRDSAESGEGQLLFVQDVLLQDPAINRVRMLCLIFVNELCVLMPHPRPVLFMYFR